MSSRTRKPCSFTSRSDNRRNRRQAREEKREKGKGKRGKKRIKAKGKRRKAKEKKREQRMREQRIRKAGKKEKIHPSSFILPPFPPPFLIRLPPSWGASRR